MTSYGAIMNVARYFSLLTAKRGGFYCYKVLKSYKRHEKDRVTKPRKNAETRKLWIFVVEIGTGLPEVEMENWK